MALSAPSLMFEVIFDDEFSSFNTDSGIDPDTNKHVVSAINDFADGHWRFSRFQKFIWDNIVDTALSSAERNALANQSLSLLAEAAKKLRLTDSDDDIGKGSELAEIVLYGIMKHHYRALPVVPKIFYKQNNQDNAKGADSVHIVVDGNDFSIWIGEAKFYNDIKNARLASIVESVGNALQSDKLEKENSIVTNINDLDYLIGDATLRSSIKSCLQSGASIDDLKSRLHVPILMLHECAITKACTRLTTAYKNDVIAYHKGRAQSYFKKQVEELKAKVFLYEEITFHLILFPVPEKKKIVDRFLSNVEHFKNQ
ncbi:MAG: DUF1837 domain-containing protein [Rhodocyclaceae bacterium]|nr:DUF1837 domain-containing protein [Rhodocyclaceae bacterium]